MPLHAKLFGHYFQSHTVKKTGQISVRSLFLRSLANGSAPVQGIHVSLRRHDAQGHQLALAGVAEVVAHAAGHMDPGAELQGHPFLVDQKVALPLDKDCPSMPDTRKVSEVKQVYDYLGNPVLTGL